MTDKPKYGAGEEDQIHDSPNWRDNRSMPNEECDAAPVGAAAPDIEKLLQNLLVEQVTLDGLFNRGAKNHTAPVDQQRGRVYAASSAITRAFSLLREERDAAIDGWNSAIEALTPSSRILEENARLRSELEAKDQQIFELIAEGDEKFQESKQGQELIRLRSELERLWTCPKCNFSFAAEHANDDGSGYSCPLCELAALEQENAKLRASSGKEK